MSGTTGEAQTPGAPGARSMVGVALALAVVVPAALALAWSPERGTGTSFPLDDAWIHQVYVRGWLRDGVPTYNAGEPEAGFSSLLWLIACLPAGLWTLLSGADPVLPVIVTSMGIGLAAAFALGRVARGLGGAPAVGWLALLVGTTAPFVVSSVAAMESALLLLCLASLVWALRPAGRPLEVGVWLALACLARPEAAVVAPLVGSAALLRARASGGGLVRPALAMVVPSVVGGACWFALNLAAVGDPLPNTFHVKAAAGGDTWAGNLRWLRAVADEPGVVQAGMLAILLAIGGGGAFGRRGAEIRCDHEDGAGDSSRLDADAARRLAGWIVAIVAVGLLSTLLSRTFHPRITFYQDRYLHPWGLLALPVVAVALASLGTSRARAAGLAAVVVGVGAWALPHALERRADLTAEIRALHEIPAREAAVATPAGARIGVEGAGAMAYFSDRPVLDLLGLNHAPIAHAADLHARDCAILRWAPNTVVVPWEWMDPIQESWEVRLLHRYDLARSGVYRDGRPRRLAVAQIRPRPERFAHCGVR